MALAAEWSDVVDTQRRMLVLTFPASAVRQLRYHTNINQQLTSLFTLTMRRTILSTPKPSDGGDRAYHFCHTCYTPTVPVRNVPR
jgi:hypothetical protein